MKKIYSELARIQQELKAPKNLYNKFGNYKYRNAEGILEAVKPLLNGLALLVNDDIVQIGDRYYIKATATLTDGEESVSTVAYAREDETKKGMDCCQVTGACSSYARKYALNALLMIDDSKDSDDDALSPKNPANETQETTKAEVKARVQQVDKVPPVKADKKDDPVTKYLVTSMKEMCDMRGISPKENSELFTAQANELIKNGLAPNKSLYEYTMEEALALVDKMYNRFDPMGTELKPE